MPSALNISLMALVQKASFNFLHQQRQISSSLPHLTNFETLQFGRPGTSCACFSFHDLAVTNRYTGTLASPIMVMVMVMVQRACRSKKHVAASRETRDYV